MEVYVKIEFPLTVGRYGMKGATISSEQYLPYIQSISNLSLNIGDDHDFEVSNVSILFDDIDGHFRDRFSDVIDKNIQGSIVTFYQLDGTKITTLKIWNYKFLSDRDFEITCTNKIGELWNDFTEKITFEEFPNTSSADSVGEVIPDCYGEMAAGGGTGGTVKAWQVEANEYLINATVIAGSTLDNAYLEDGTDITANTVIGTTADGLRTTATYSLTDPDFIVCNFTIGSFKANDVQDVLEANLNKWVTFNSGNYTPKASLNSYLDGAKFNNDFRYYANTQPKIGTELLKDFCNSYNVDYITNSDNEIEIKWIDIENLTADYTIQDNKAKEFMFTSETDSEDYVNSVLTQGHYNDYTQTYQKQFEINEFESQSLYGIRPANIPTKFLKTDQSIVWSAKYFTMFNKNPRQRAYVQMGIDDWFNLSLEVGDKIEFKHPDDRLQATAYILYQIRKVNINFTGNIVDLELWDIDYLKNIDTDINLLIQPGWFGGNGYLDYFDMSMRLDGLGNRALNPALSIINSDTELLFGKSSVYAWGSRRITSTSSVVWDLFNSVAVGGDATISAYIYIHDLSTTYTDAQTIMTHYQDVNNYWRLQMPSVGGVGTGSTGELQFTLRSGGVDIIDITSATAMSTGQWYHVALCKKNDGVNQNIGIYIGGTQENFGTTANTYNFTGLLHIFGNNTTGKYLQAYVAEAFLSNTNFYSGNPVVAVTDTIAPFYHPLTQSADKKTLKVYNPREGDNLTIGNIYRIKWNIPGLNVNIELWNSVAGAKISDIALGVINKQYYDWDTTGVAAADRTVKVVAVDDIGGSMNDWSDVFTLA